MPAAKGGGKKAKDPGKQLVAAAPAVDPRKLHEQHGQLTNENSELKALRSQLLAKEKAMREKIEKLRAIAAATGKTLKPPPGGGGGLLLGPPKLKAAYEPQFGGSSTPHTPIRPRMLKKFKNLGNGFSPTKSPRKYKPMKIPVKIPKIKPSGDPELDKLRREAAVLEAQNAVLTRQRSGLRRGVKTLAANRDDLSQSRVRIVHGYKGKRSKLKQILAKHNKYKKKEQQLDKQTSKRLMEIERQFRARGLDFPNLDPRLESSPPKLQRHQRPHGQRSRGHGSHGHGTHGGSHDVLRGRVRGNHPGGLDMRRFESHLRPTTPKRTNLHKLRAPRRNRSKSLPRAHTQSYLRKHTRANLSKNSYSRSRRMSRQRDRPNDLDVPRRKSREVLSIGAWTRIKAVDDDMIVRESRRRMRRTALGAELPQLEAYSSLPDLRASSERNYRNGEDNQPLSRVIEEPSKKSKPFGTPMPPMKRSKSDPTDKSSRDLRRPVFLPLLADAKVLEGDSTKRLVSALKELSPNAAVIVQRRADKLRGRAEKLQHKRSKARRKSIQRQKKAARARAKGGSKTALSSVPTDAARKENIAYSQSLNNLGLSIVDRRAPPERYIIPRGAATAGGDDKTSYSAKDFDMKWSGKFRELERQFQASLRRAKGSAERSRIHKAEQMALQRSASQQRVRETPGKADKVSRRHSLGAFDFESLYTRKAPRTRKRNKNKERSKSVDRDPSKVASRLGSRVSTHRRIPSRQVLRGKRSKSSEGFRSNLGTLKIKKPHGHHASGASRVTRGYRDPLDEAMSDFRKLTPENFESKYKKRLLRYKKLHKRVKKGLIADEEKPRYDDFVRSLKDGTRMATSKQVPRSYFDAARKKGRAPGSPDPTPMPSYKKRNNDWWTRMNNLKLALDTLST